VARLAEAGVDMSEFVKGLVRHFRDLFVLAAVGADGVIDTTAGDRGRLESQATCFGTDRIARIIDVLARLTTELRYASDQRLSVEVALTRMARPQADLTLESIAERVDALEAGAPLRDYMTPVKQPAPATAAAEPAVPAAPAAAPAAPASGNAEGAPDAPASEAAPAAAPAPAPRAPSAGLDIASVKRAWPAVLAEFKKHKKSRSHIFNGTEVEVDGATLVVEFPAEQGFALELAQDTETIALLRRCVASVLGIEPPIEYRLGRGGASAHAAPHVDVAPAADLDDTSPAATPHPSELERMVIDELGAEVIEHRDGEPGERGTESE